MNTSAALVAAALALATTLEATAQTPPCGSTVTGVVRLTSQLRCPAGMDALIVGSDNVRIRLNGFTISAPGATPGVPTAAVRSAGFHAVEIVGPGNIVGFSEAIHITGGTSHLIKSVSIEGDNSISLRNVSGARVQANRFSWLTLLSDPGMAATGNHIFNNELVPGPLGGGMQLIGCGTQDNTVVKNKIETGLAHAIRLALGPSGNQIIGNTALQGGIHLWNAGLNVVERNYVEVPDNVDAIVLLSTGAGATCPKGTPLDSTQNEVTKNELVGGRIGVHLLGHSTRNLITDNALSRQVNWALSFTNFADHNDARGNRYLTQGQISDSGIGNLWP